MTDHADKAVSLAAKIAAKAEDALRDLDQAMTFGRWPADCRAIMWGAVADIAFKRKVEAEALSAAGERGGA